MKEPRNTLIQLIAGLTASCAKGEEKILINFVNGPILLDSKKKSHQDLRHAIASFESAITLANEEDYGMNMGQYGRIRLAQAYVGSSLNDPAKSREGLSQHNIDNAKRVLRDLEHTDMKHRIRWSYLLTCSDVYRLDGQMDQANAYADRAFDWAQEHELGHEIKSKLVEFRQKYLRNTVTDVQFINSSQPSHPVVHGNAECDSSFPTVKTQLSRPAHPIDTSRLDPWEYWG